MILTADSTKSRIIESLKSKERGVSCADYTSFSAEHGLWLYITNRLLCNT